jgi:hypothetical protein
MEQMEGVKRMTRFSVHFNVHQGGYDVHIPLQIVILNNFTIVGPLQK